MTGKYIKIFIPLDNSLTACYPFSMKNGFVYILTNKSNSVLYIGVTSNPKRRLYEHRNHLIQGFTDKYNVTKVVYIETTSLLSDAISREKQLKKWSRQKKLDLIKSFNPLFNDLYENFINN